MYQSPTPAISGPSSGCLSVPLTTDVYTSYQWYRDGYPISGATGRSYDATVTGTYVVFITDGNGCQAYSSAKYVTVSATYPSPSISGNSIGCSASGITLSTGSFSVYQWNYEGTAISGATGQTYVAHDSGNYSVTVTNAGGYQATSGTKAVSLYQTPPVVTGPSSACSGTGITLSTGSYPSYQWYKDGTALSGQTAQTLDVYEEGNYTIEVTVPAGSCSGTSDVHHVTFGPMPAAQPEITGSFSSTCPSTSVTLQTTEEFGSYQWNYNWSAIPGATSRELTASLPGFYSVSAGAVPACRMTSQDQWVSIPFCSTSEVSPKVAFFPARVSKDPDSSTGFYLYFQKMDGANGYNIYEGTLGNWYSHSAQPGNVCAATVTDLGTGEMRAEVTLSAGDHYYLVTAYSGAVEGPSGFNSANVEIDPLLSSCSP